MVDFHPVIAASFRNLKRWSSQIMFQLGKATHQRWFKTSKVERKLGIFSIICSSEFDFLRFLSYEIHSKIHPARKMFISQMLWFDAEWVDIHRSVNRAMEPLLWKSKYSIVRYFQIFQKCSLLTLRSRKFSASTMRNEKEWKFSVPTQRNEKEWKFSAVTSRNEKRNQNFQPLLSTKTSTYTSRHEYNEKQVM